MSYKWELQPGLAGISWGPTLVVSWLNAFGKSKMKEKKNKINRSKKPPTPKPWYHLSGRIHRLKEKEKMRTREREREERQKGEREGWQGLERKTVGERRKSNSSGVIGGVSRAQGLRWQVITHTQYALTAQETCQEKIPHANKQQHSKWHIHAGIPTHTRARQSLSIVNYRRGSCVAEISSERKQQLSPQKWFVNTQKILRV